MPSWVFLCPHPLQPEVPRGTLPLCSLELIIRELACALAKAGQEVRVLAPEAARRRLDGFDLLPEGDLLSLASAAEVDVLVRVGGATLDGTRAVRGLRLQWDPFAEGSDWPGADLSAGTEHLPIVLVPELAPTERTPGRPTLALCEGPGLVASLLVEQHRAEGLLFVGWRSSIAPKGAPAARPSSYAEAANLMAQASAFVSASTEAAEAEPWLALATELGVPGGRSEVGPGVGLQRWLALADAVRVGLDRFRGTGWRGPTTTALPPQAVRLISDFIGAHPLAWEGTAPPELAEGYRLVWLRTTEHQYSHPRIFARHGATRIRPQRERRQSRHPRSSSPKNRVPLVNSGHTSPTPRHSLPQAELPTPSANPFCSVPRSVSPQPVPALAGPRP